MKLDTINWKILKELQLNSRRPLTEISKIVGLSSPTVAERIQKMEEQGIIKQYSTHINYDALGYNLCVYISIKIRFGQVENFENYITTVPEIVECHKLTGQDCMLMKGHVKNPKHLEKLNAKLADFGELTTSLLLKSLIETKVCDRYF